MKRVIILLLSSVVFFGCEKTQLEKALDGKLKTRFIFSSSTDSEPHSFATYSYDKDGKLIKELISNYPGPPFSSSTYEYTDNGKLFKKRYTAMEGLNSPNQTESDFTLIYENKYEYVDNKQIEKLYRNNQLIDSAVFIFSNELIVSEHHYKIKEKTEWSIINNYDSNGNLTKMTSMPEGSYSIYEYTGSKLHKVTHFDQSNSLLTENIYEYTSSKNMEIIEIHYKGPYGDFISAKTKLKNGLVVEYIKYHPTFIGAEWTCERYEYY